MNALSCRQGGTRSRRGSLRADHDSSSHFSKKVFNTTGRYRLERPSEIAIGDSIVMISEAGARRPTTAFLYVYVRDVDRTYRRAIAARARSLEAPIDLPYGDRRCMVKDAWGNTWQIATRLPQRRRVRRTAVH